MNVVTDEMIHELHPTAWHAGWFAFDKVHPCKICGLTWEEFSK